MDIDYEALLQSFLAESEEGLALMEEALLVLERRPGDDEALGTAFRVAHTIKGTAAMFEFANVGDLAHGLEELLDRLRGGSLTATGDIVSLLLKAVDALRDLIPAAAAGREEMSQGAKSVLEQLNHVTAPGIPGSTVVPPVAESEAPEPTTEKTAGSRQDTPQARGPAREIAVRTAATLRVDLDKLDRLLRLTGEIGIARGRLAQMLEDPEQSRETALETLREADFVHMELQELVMKLRMVSLGPTFRRYRRTVRDLAGAHGKTARLVTEGEEVEVDATVIEHLRDPLTHMVRNALDHGIESPEARTVAGKDPSGLLALRAWHEASSVVIELSDDGAGVDRQRVLERARAAKIVTADGELSDQEIENLIFEPGFSTAETVTDLSGRGVGMDVVRRNIETLRGSVAISSRHGEGTTITARLPLTLAILDGLTVAVANETFFIPLETVVESVELPPGEQQQPDGRGVLNLRGMTLPYVRLRHLFSLEGTAPVRENVIVVERRDQQLAGLVVDSLEGQSQAVIKPLAKLFRGLPGISGSTILGSGRVALILDVPSLLHLAEGSEQPS